MASSKKFTPEQSWDWLQNRLSELGMSSLEQMAEKSGIHKGTLSKYFHQLQRPKVIALQPLCECLEVSPNTLLVALGVFPENTFKK